MLTSDQGGASGTILFGGIDTSKYTGELVTLNLLPVPIQTTTGGVAYEVYEFVVAVTALSATSSGTTTRYFQNGAADGTTGSLPVLLDTGSAAWTVPESIYNSIAKVLPGLDEYGNLPCSAQNDNITLTLTFGGVTDITVPMKELVVPVYDPLTNKQNTTSSGAPLCTFMLTPGEATREQPFLTLGDAILRSMYVVFDLDNGQVSIAQARTNISTTSGTSASGSNIKIVPAGANGVASAVGSGVSTTSKNTATIAPAVSATGVFRVVTTTPAVGTATGTGAIPDSGRVAETTYGTASSSASASSKTSASGTAKSSGVAAGLVVPRMQWSVIISAVIAVVGMGAGAALLI